MRLAFDPDEGDLVPVGAQGGVLPECFRVFVDPGPDDPADAPVVDFRVRVVNGQVGVDCVSIESRDDRAMPLSALRSLRLLEWLIEAVAQRLRVRTDEGRLTGATAEVIEEVVGRIQRRRRAVSADRLGEVADHYRAGGWKRVSDRLGVSESQAHRLVAAAREAKLLEPRRKSPRITRKGVTR